MSSIINYFGAHVFDAPQVYRGTCLARKRCHYCALEAQDATHHSLFRSWRLPSGSETSPQPSLSVCVFCAQALCLEVRNVQDGIVYLLPELQQSSVIRLTVAAYALLSASASAVLADSDDGSNRTLETANVVARTHCVKAAQDFLNLLNRVGVARWQQAQISGWRPEYLLDLLSQLRGLKKSPWRAQALRNVAQTMRYVPIRSSRNQSRIELIARHNWNLPSQFEYWFKVFLQVQHRLALIEISDA